jgi:hypothetical protein
MLFLLELLFKLEVRLMEPLFLRVFPLLRDTLDELLDKAAELPGSAEVDVG